MIGATDRRRSGGPTSVSAMRNHVGFRRDGRDDPSAKGFGPQAGACLAIVRASRILAVALLAFISGSAGALTTSDQPSSILIFPYIVADASRGIDTNLRLTNTSNNRVSMRCFYEDHTRHCDTDGSVCDDDHPCAGAAGCAPGFVITEFVLHMAEQQPLEWQLSVGLTDVPAPATGTVPAAPEQPFVGVLRCVEVDAAANPIGGNHVIGSATVQTTRKSGDQSVNDWARYNAVGMQGTDLAGETGNELKLGGADGQYAGCNNAHVLTHSYDGVQSPANPERTIETTVIMVPCASDLGASTPAEVTVGYSSINEFDQRLVSGQFLVSGQRIQTLRQIDTVLTAAGAGTVTGQTRFSPVAGGGFIVLAIESHHSANPDVLPASAGLNVFGRGDLEQADLLILPPYGTPNTPTITPTPSRTRTPSATPLAPDAYEPDNTPAMAHSIACGETQVRSSHVPNDDDWALLTLTEPTGITIDAVGPGLTLFDANLEALSLPGTGRIDIPCGAEQLAAGTYYVKAHGPPFTVIPHYNLNLHCTPCTSPTPTPSPSPTSSPTVTSTESPTAAPKAPPCAGDCDAGGQVSVDELVRGVKILLGSLRVSRCTAFDVNGDGRVTVDELVKGVNGLLHGCGVPS